MKFLVLVLLACVAVVSCQQDLQREKRGFLGGGLLAAPAVAAPAVFAAPAVVAAPAVAAVAAPAVVAAPAAIGYGYGGYIGGAHGRLVHG